MRADTMPLDHTFNETIHHGQSNFPIQYYVDELYKFRERRVPLHWHIEPEFFVVRGGDVVVQITNQRIHLKPNDGIFISSNTLHSFEQINENDVCECPNIVFSTDLIAPYSSTIYQKYISPFLSKKNLPYFVLRSDILWQNKVLKELSFIFSLLQNNGIQSPYGKFPLLNFNVESLDDACFEMEVQRRLNQVWQIMFTHLDQIPNVEQDRRELQYQVRLQQMILFIQQNYMNQVTLESISVAANISKSEASRCFHTYLKCSPVEYLIQFRIEVSQQLLVNTTRSVQEICLDCGFNAPSYFIKVFKNLLGMTPKQYRKSILMKTETHSKEGTQVWLNC